MFCEGLESLDRLCFERTTHDDRGAQGNAVKNAWQRLVAQGPGPGLELWVLQWATVRRGPARLRHLAPRVKAPTDVPR